MGAEPKPRVVVIVGPTGSGKSDLALRLAEKFTGEIIAADSRTVYRGMDIGTAKERRDGSRRAGEYLVHGIPHHLLDIRNPDERYSVAEFARDTEAAIVDSASRGRIAIVVGGTGLYVRALVDGFSVPDVAGDPRLRAALERKTDAQLRRTLAKLDPASARAIDPKNRRRLIRAIEVTMRSGQPFSALRQRHAPQFDFLMLGVQRDRPTLSRRIAVRTQAMFDAGLVREVRRIVRRYGADIEPLRGMIYRDVVAWLQLPHRQRPPIAELVHRAAADQRRYARHQMMWWKHDDRIHWVSAYRDAERLVRTFIGRRMPPPR